ncbi:MAG: hypothetical protein EOP24_27875 [Hyphomicrobiales bacterium]|nr:MAG: hypothetical protein EOP24_27875 [Hyphomicrobiales bacterium]
MQQFEPNDQQSQLIKEADRLHAQAVKSGRFISLELSRRIRNEQDMSSFVSASESNEPKDGTDTVLPADAGPDK